jgi:hypothetical protein
LVGAFGGPVDGEARLPKRPRVSRKLQPLVAAWPKCPSRTVASLLGHGPGFSASPSPAMGPTHYGEVSATHRGKVSSVILPLLFTQPRRRGPTASLSSDSPSSLGFGYPSRFLKPLFNPFVPQYTRGAQCSAGRSA